MTTITEVELLRSLLERMEHDRKVLLNACLAHLALVDDPRREMRRSREIEDARQMRGAVREATGNARAVPCKHADVTNWVASGLRECNICGEEV